MAKRSAGILMFRTVGGAVEVLLVHPGGPFWAGRDEGAWSVPKGEYEDGEEARAAALREFQEETGCRPPDGGLIDLGTVRHRSGKVVHAWAVEGDFDPGSLRSNTFALEWPRGSGTEREFPEVDRAEWFAPARAREKLIAAQGELVERLLDELQASGRLTPSAEAAGTAGGGPGAGRAPGAPPAPEASEPAEG